MDFGGKKEKGLPKSKPERKRIRKERQSALKSGRNRGKMGVQVKKGRRNPLKSLNEFLHTAAERGSAADVVAEEGEGCLSSDLLFAAAKEPGRAIVMLNGAKRMLRDAHPFLLFVEILAYGQDNARGLFGNAAKGVVMVGLGNMCGDLLKWMFWGAIDLNGDIDGIRPELDLLGGKAIGAAAGAGAAGFETGIDGAVFADMAGEERLAGRAGDRAVGVTDKAADSPRCLEPDREIRVSIAVRQNTRVQAGLNVLRLSGGKELWCDLRLKIVKNKNALYLVDTEPYIRNNAVFEAGEQILSTVIALVCNGGDALHSEILFCKLRGGGEQIAVVGLVGDIQRDHHMGIGVHG